MSRTSEAGTVPARTRRARRKPRDRPLLIVITGHGKGKSTSAFGMMLRGWARGYRVGVFQFVKSGKWKVGEHTAARELGGIDWEKMGDGWTWTSRDLDESADLAREGWEEVKRRIADETYELLVLDEFTYPDDLRLGRHRRGGATLAARDRASSTWWSPAATRPPQLVEAADLVSEVARSSTRSTRASAGSRGSSGDPARGRGAAPPRASARPPWPPA